MRYLVSLLCLSFLLSGCETLQTRKGIEEKQQREQMNQQISNISKSTADQESRFQEIESLLRKMNGNFETYDYKFNNLEKAREADIKEMQKKQEVSEEKLKAYQESILALEQQVAQLQKEMASRPAVSTSEDRGEKGSLKGVNKKKRTEKEWFDDAETLYSKKEYKKAILAFQSYRDMFPKGKYYAAATFKIGDSFYEVSMKNDGKAFLQEVMEKFPSSDWAKRAKKRLATK